MAQESHVPDAIRDPASAGFTPQAEQRVIRIDSRCLLPFHTITSRAHERSLQIDLGDTSLSGRVFYGQAFFGTPNTEYLQTRYRERADLRHGKALLTLDPFLQRRSYSNANKWTVGGIVGYRLDLLQTTASGTTPIGMYDSQVYFTLTDSGVRPIISIVEGPIVSLVQSDHPDWMVIFFETDRPGRGIVQVEGGGLFTGPANLLRHEVHIAGLTAANHYRYRAGAIDGADTAWTPWLSFQSAPVKGASNVTFAYAGDARASFGGGEYEYMGVNRTILNQILINASRQRVDFFLFGGDLIGGFNSSVRDHRMQMRGFKQAAAPFLYHTPLYSAVGNHETLARFYLDSSQRRIGFDRWPYETESAEAVFADEFVQPDNGPSPQPGLPPYRETAFAFHYGAVKVIVFNNNYWYANTSRAKEIGGSPEGYILPEQLAWIERELRNGDADPAVRYIVLLAQEPVFPAGGHTSDAMWYHGNNTIRAYKRAADGTVVPSTQGIIEVRNALWQMISNTRKVACVLGSDEHNYQRMLIDQRTPVGVLSDDLNGDGVLNDGRISPNPEFRSPVWFIISGGAGAPYYTQQEAPWSVAAKAFSPQHHHLLFRSTRERIGLEVYSNSGELIDEVKDLMQVRNSRPSRGK